MKIKLYLEKGYRAYDGTIALEDRYIVLDNKGFDICGEHISKEDALMVVKDNNERQMKIIINKIVKAELMRDKYSQGVNYNPRLQTKYYDKCQQLQREYYNIQMELGLIKE